MRNHCPFLLVSFLLFSGCSALDKKDPPSRPHAPATPNETVKSTDVRDDSSAVPGGGLQGTGLVPPGQGVDVPREQQGDPSRLKERDEAPTRLKDSDGPSDPIEGQKSPPSDGGGPRGFEENASLTPKIGGGDPNAPDAGLNGEVPAGEESLPKEDALAGTSDDKAEPDKKVPVGPDGVYDPSAEEKGKKVAMGAGKIETPDGPLKNLEEDRGKPLDDDSGRIPGPDGEHVEMGSQLQQEKGEGSRDDMKHEVGDTVNQNADLDPRTAPDVKRAMEEGRVPQGPEHNPSPSGLRLIPQGMTFALGSRNSQDAVQSCRMEALQQVELRELAMTESAFVLENTPELPLTLTPGTNLLLRIRFVGSTSSLKGMLHLKTDRGEAQVSLSYSETP